MTTAEYFFLEKIRLGLKLQGLPYLTQDESDYLSKTAKEVNEMIARDIAFSVENLPNQKPHLVLRSKCAQALTIAFNNDTNKDYWRNNLSAIERSGGDCAVSQIVLVDWHDNGGGKQLIRTSNGCAALLVISFGLILATKQLVSTLNAS